VADDSHIESATGASNMTATYTIDKLTMKFLGVNGTVYRLFKNGELIRVYDSMAEAEAAQAAL
jgi:hypothetical protein